MVHHHAGVAQLDVGPQEGRQRKRQSPREARARPRGIGRRDGHQPVAFTGQAELIEETLHDHLVHALGQLGHDATLGAHGGNDGEHEPEGKQRGRQHRQVFDLIEGGKLFAFGKPSAKSKGQPPFSDDRAHAERLEQRLDRIFGP